MILYFCEYWNGLELIYPSYHSYVFAFVLSKALETYWFSDRFYGKEWHRLSFPKKFYMNGIPHNDFSKQSEGFGFNILMTLAIAQILVFVKGIDNKMLTALHYRSKIQYDRYQEAVKNLLPLLIDLYYLI